MEQEEEKRNIEWEGLRSCGGSQILYFYPLKP
jgi:hypothetical protein